MKKTIFAALAALCLLATTTTLAQDQKPAPAPKERPTAEQMAQRRTDRMKEKLSLTDDQYKQVYTLNLEQIKQMQAQREQARQAGDAKLKSLLTNEQYQQYAQMKRAAADKYRGHHGGKAGQGHRAPQAQPQPQSK